MEILYLFGYKLAELIKQNDSAGLSLLCLAIKDAGKTTQQMGYQDFKEVFSQHLPTRLEKLKVTHRDQTVLFTRVGKVHSPSSWGYLSCGEWRSLCCTSSPSPSSSPAIS